MRHGYRSQDYHRISNEHDARMYSAGIPSDFWEINPDYYDPTKMRFGVLSDSQKMLSTPDQQIKAWSHVASDPDSFRRNYFVVIGSQPSDIPSRSSAYYLGWKALSLNHRIHVSPFFGESEKEDGETVFILDGLWDDLEREQISNVRRWFIKHADCFVIMPIFGDPIKFIDRCGFTPDYVFYLDGNRKQEINMV